MQSRLQLAVRSMWKPEKIVSLQKASVMKVRSQKSSLTSRSKKYVSAVVLHCIFFVYVAEWEMEALSAIYFAMKINGKISGENNLCWQLC